MYDAPTRAGSHPPIFQPKAVHFSTARPAFATSYSSPLLGGTSSAASSPPDNMTSPSGSPSPPSPHSKPSHALSNKHGSRPKMTKKMSSTPGKHKSVQVALEVKVERSRGFHAFFVPLARNMPPAPPSSPVFNQSSNHSPHHAAESSWPSHTEPKSVCEEHWVEDVQHMEID